MRLLVRRKRQKVNTLGNKIDGDATNVDNSSKVAEWIAHVAVPVSEGVCLSNPRHPSMRLPTAHGERS